jgi:hypothetical protein
VSIAAEDLVASDGRIKGIQNGRVRHIEFSLARVVDVGPAGITVNPVGMKAEILCRPDDLVVANSKDEREPEQLPDFDAAKAPDLREGDVITVEKTSEPAGDVPISGEVEPPKPKRKARTIKEKAAEDKPTPRPRRRR